MSRVRIWQLPWLHSGIHRCQYLGEISLLLHSGRKKARLFALRSKGGSATRVAPVCQCFSVHQRPARIPCRSLSYHPDALCDCYLLADSQKVRSGTGRFVIEAFLNSPASGCSRGDASYSTWHSVVLYPAHGIALFAHVGSTSGMNQHSISLPAPTAREHG